MNQVTPLEAKNYGADQMGLLRTVHPFYCTEIMIHIFHTFGPASFAQQAIGLSLVCRQWRHCVISSPLWKDIFFELGMPMPIKRDALQAYRDYNRSCLSVGQLRECDNIHQKEFHFDIDFSTYNQITFLYNTHIIAHDSSEICICSLTQSDSIRRINTKREIVSLCADNNIVFCGLNTNEVFAYSLDGKELYSINTHPQEGQNLYRVLAKDEWLVTALTFQVKLWNSEKGQLIHQINNESRMDGLQIDCDTLYWTNLTEDTLSCKILYSWPLNGEDFGPFAKLESDGISAIYVHGNNCSFIKSLPKVAGEDEIDAITTFNFTTKEDFTTSLQTLVHDGSPSLFAFNRLAIVIWDLSNAIFHSEDIDISSNQSDEDISDSNDGEVPSNPNAYSESLNFFGSTTKTFHEWQVINKVWSSSTCPPYSRATYAGDIPLGHYDSAQPIIPDTMIFLMDTEMGSIWRLCNHTVHRSSNKWSFTATHGGLIYITDDNKVVEVTFPKANNKKGKLTEATRKG